MVRTSWARLGLDQLPVEPGHLHQAGDLGQRPHVRAGVVHPRQEHEHHPHLLAVDRLELDALGGDPEGRRQRRNRGMLAVRNRHALADAGGALGLAGPDGRQRPRPVGHLAGRDEDVDHLLEAGFLVAAFQADLDDRFVEQIP